MHWTQHWWRQVKREYLEIVRRRERRVAAARDRGVRHVRVAGDGETAGFLSADSAQPSVTAARHTCHVSILILQTLSTRLGNYWFVRHSTGMVTWLLSYMLQLALCSHFILVTFCTSTPYHLEYLHTYRIVVYGGQCQWNAAHLSQLCQSSKCGLVRFYAACCFKHFVFFGARHRPGRFSSRVSNFDIELYINIHNI